MRAENIEQIGDELAIKWSDHTDSFFRLERLRRACPCAGCKGETDIFGNVYKSPIAPLKASAFELAGLSKVGNYGVTLLWGDGHGSGIYTFDYLAQLDAAQTDSPSPDTPH